MAAPNKRIKTSDSNSRSAAVSGSVQFLLVPTITEKESQTIDMQSMNAEEIKALQTKDPFLYYSIPGVREAAIALKEVDLSQANKSAVSRKTRVSFETDTSVLVEDLLESELDGLEYPDDAGLGELDDLIDSLLLRVK